MSNQNDLDDQLYILLASMKEYREAIACVTLTQLLIFT